MSKRKRQSKGKPPSKKKRSKSGSSLIIPIVVGVVVLVIIVGAILSIEGQQTATASRPATTSQPLATTDIPYPNVPRISVQETKEGLETGQIVVVDVRSQASYDNSHIAGALSIPEGEIDARLDELPRDKDVVFY
jgi:flagellar basal body-associated protein FliL